MDSPHSLLFNDSFSQNKSTTPETSTRYDCDLQVFSIDGVMRGSRNTRKFHPATFMTITFLCVFKAVVILV